MSLALKIKPLPVGNETGQYDRVRNQYKGLKSVTRQWEVVGSSRQYAGNLIEEAKSLFDAYGTKDGETTNTAFNRNPDSQSLIFPDMYLEEQEIKSRDPNSSSAILTKVYQEAYLTFREIEKPVISTDSRGRKTTSRTMVILNSAGQEAIDGTIGTPDEEFPDQVYVSQQAEVGNAVTIVKREFLQATENLEEVGDAKFTLDEFNRRTTERTYIVLSSVDKATKEGVLGTPDVDDPRQVYVNQVAQDNGVVTTIRRKFVEATGNLEEIGSPSFSIDEFNRNTTKRNYIILSTADDSIKDGVLGTPDVDDPRQVYVSQTSEDRGITTVITRNFIEATASLEEISSPRFSRDEFDRHTTERAYIVLSAADNSVKEGVLGTADVDDPRQVYVNQTSEDRGVTTLIRRNFIEATSSLEEISSPKFSRDEFNRHTTERTYIILSSALDSAKDGVLGTPDVDDARQVYVNQTSEDRGVTTLIRRNFIEATSSLEEIGNPKFSRDEFDRHTTERTYIILSSALDSAKDGILGTPDVDDANQVYVSQTSEDRGITTVIRRNFIEATLSLEEIGSPKFSRDEFDRHTTERTYIILSAADDSIKDGVLGDADVDDARQVYVSQTSEDRGITTVIRRNFIEATSSLEEIGNPKFSRDEFDRHTTERTYIILSSALDSAKDGVLGTPDVDDARQVYVNQTSEDRGITTVIRRNFIEATSSLEEIGTPKFSINENNRRTTERTYIILSSALDSAKDGVLGTPDVDDARQVYVNQTSEDRGITTVIRRQFFEATSQWEVFSGDQIEYSTSGLKKLTRSSVALVNTSYNEDIQSSTITHDSVPLVLSDYKIEENEVFSKVVEVWSEVGILSVSQSFVGGDAEVSITAFGMTEAEVSSELSAVIGNHVLVSESISDYEGVIGSRFQYNADSFDVVSYTDSGLKRVSRVELSSNSFSEGSIVIGTSRLDNLINGPLAVSQEIDNDNEIKKRTSSWIEEGILSVSQQLVGGRAQITVSCIGLTESDVSSELTAVIGDHFLVSESTSNYEGIKSNNFQYESKSFDVVSYTENGLKRLVRTELSASNFSTSSIVVGTTVLDGLISSGQEIDNGNSIKKRTSNWAESGLIDAAKQDEGDGLLYVRFVSQGVRIVPTAKSGSISGEPHEVFQGGLAAPVYRKRTSDVEGFKTYETVIMLDRDGSNLVEGDEVMDVTTWDTFKYPGYVDLNRDEGMVPYSGSVINVLVRVRDIMTKDGSLSVSDGVPFSIKAGCSARLSYTPVETGLSESINKSFGPSYLRGTPAIAGIGGDFLGMPVEAIAGTATSNPTYAEFLSTSSAILEKSIAEDKVMDDGTVWYRVREIKLVGRFSDYL